MLATAWFSARFLHVPPPAARAQPCGATGISSVRCSPTLVLTYIKFCPAPLQDNGISDWSGVAAVLCGQKDMATAVTELLTSKGVPKERILTNF